MNPVQVRLVSDVRLRSLRLLRQLRFGIDEVNLGQKLVRVKNLGNIRAHLVAEHRQNPDDLAPLLGLQLPYTIVGLDHLRWLNKHRLARSRLIVNDAAYALLQVGRHRYHQAAVAQRWSSVLVHQSVLLGTMKYCV